MEWFNQADTVIQYFCNLILIFGLVSACFRSHYVRPGKHPSPLDTRARKNPHSGAPGKGYRGPVPMLTPLGPTRAGAGSGRPAVLPGRSPAGKGRTGREMAASRVASRRRNA